MGSKEMTEIHANMIIPRLWLGDKVSASDTEFLKKENITAVFNCTKDYPFVESIPNKFRLPINDSPEYISTMTGLAPEYVYNIVRLYNSGHSILIHCHAGRQRSAAIMAMVLISLMKVKAETAIDFIKERRSQAFFPFINFYISIKEFEKNFFAVYNSTTNTK